MAANRRFLSTVGLAGVSESSDVLRFRILLRGRVFWLLSTELFHFLPLFSVVDGGVDEEEEEEVVDDVLHPPRNDPLIITGVGVEWIAS